MATTSRGQILASNPYARRPSDEHEHSSSSSASRPKRQRVKKWAPKSHNGCDTCKQRRIKCDETKPTCLRCSRSRRECKGYNVPRAMIFELADTDDGKRSLAYYREKVGPAISGHFEQFLWVDFTVKICYQEAVIRNCVVAVSTSYEDCVSTERGHIARASRLSKHSVRQISKSYQALAEQGSTLSIDLFLLSTVILISLEELQGEYEHAVMHLRTGLKLWAQWQQDPRILPKPSSAGKDLLELHLLPLLRRLAFQYSAMDSTLFQKSNLCGFKARQAGQEERNASGFEADPHGMQLGSIHVPEVITSPLTARSILDDLVIALVNAFSQVAKQAHHDVRDHARMQKRYLQKMKQWFRAVEAGGRKHKDLSLNDPQMKVLIIRFKLSLILQHAGPSASEMDWDRYTSVFEEIVAIAQETLDDLPEDSVGGRKVATYYAYVLWPLFLTSLLCRHPRIRRWAAGLLRLHTEREGIWTTSPGARLSDRVTELEEAGLDKVESEKDIPDRNRLCVLKVVSVKRPWQPLYRTEEAPILDVGPFFFEYSQTLSGSSRRTVNSETLKDPTWTSSRITTDTDEYLRENACVANNIRQNCYCGAFNVQILLSSTCQFLDDDEQSSVTSSSCSSPCLEDETDGLVPTTNGPFVAHISTEELLRRTSHLETRSTLSSQESLDICPR